MPGSDEAAAVAAVERMMDAAGLPPRLIASFREQYLRFRRGERGLVPWSEVGPAAPGEIVDASTATAEDRARGRELCRELVCIKLNGGLGTTMELDRAKSLVPVRDGRSFLQLIAAQVERLRQQVGSAVPLLLMNSWRTRADSVRELSGFEQPGDLPLDFIQHRVPRIDIATQMPLVDAAEEEAWAPPGHGDIYLALLLGGSLERLLARGFRWAFVSNADNLAATVDPGLLGLLARQGVDFAMEVTAKTAADVKGGPLVRRGGRLTLLERSQVPPERLEAFDSRFATFNTNNLWWRLEAVHERLQRGALDLPLIVNPKRVAGREVVQLETAMGAAVGCFDRACGLLVSRRRFAPVKGTADLLAVRSDLYELGEDEGLRLVSDRDAPPRIELDERFYRGLGRFEQRFPHPLRLRRCRSLTVAGDVRFGRDVAIEGDVALRNTGPEQCRVADGERLVDRELSW